MSQISLQYSNAISRANSLRQAASECEANRAKIQAMINDVDNGLEGAAAKTLLEKLTAWRSENDTLQIALLTAANNLTNAAEAIRAADLAAAQAAARPVAQAIAPQPASRRSSIGASFAGSIGQSKKKKRR